MKQGDLYASSDLTIRDYFAAKAMQEIIHKCIHLSAEDGTATMPDPDIVATNAYDYADEMVKEREKRIKL
jgi:hypothetical protein